MAATCAKCNRAVSTSSGFSPQFAGGNTGAALAAAIFFKSAGFAPRCPSCKGFYCSACYESGFRSGKCVCGKKEIAGFEPHHP